MPKQISGLRIARSFITPTEVAVSREIDFQLGARQGIAIDAVLGTLGPESGNTTISTSTITFHTATQTLHLETGSLETVPDAAGEDEDTIDSEIFYRQELYMAGNDDVSTEFRASLAYLAMPTSMVVFPRPIFTARNITHRGITSSSVLDMNGHIIIYYTFVEFSLSELGLILARRQ